VLNDKLKVVVGSGSGLVLVGLLVLMWKAYPDPTSLFRCLADAPTARGMITSVTAATTSIIALVLIAYIAFDGRGTMDDFKLRLDYGKQVLSIFVGILGTIVGFYYGSTGGAQPHSPMALQLAAPILVPSAAPPNGIIRITSNVSGGKPPYTYSVTFSPPVIPPGIDVQSLNGLIVYDAKIPADAKANARVIYTIKVKDSDGLDETLNNDGKWSLAIEAPPPVSQARPKGASALNPARVLTIRAPDPKTMPQTDRIHTRANISKG
jgi:hypothetical protein